MDELLREFLTETSEHLDVVDVEMLRFEQAPNDVAILRNIFRLVHTIKGTCGFLGMPRLEALTHAAETLMGRFRDGASVTTEAVSLILSTVDRIKEILGELENSSAEPEGTDGDLIEGLVRLASHSSPVAETLVSEAALSLPEASAQSVFQQAPMPVEKHSTPSSVEKALSEVIPETGDKTAAPSKQAKTIRVSVDTLEHMMTMVSELVLTRNQLLDIARRYNDNDYKIPLQRLSHVTAELQEGVMKTRMQPIGSAWQKLPRVVRDLSTDLGKTIELVMQGSDTELDRQVLELIKDPLTHMIRNSADHGIELPWERRMKGKLEAGQIRLSASHEGSTITIEITDDGRGLDISRIRRLALERRITTEAELDRMTDAQVAKFIFHAGFSTAREVTAISGRGVGMDVVKANIELIGGVVDIRSEFGVGTTFTLKIPLTLAIVAALIVSVGAQKFALPQGSVLELVRVKAGSDHVVEHINGASVLRLRDRLLPVVSLGNTLGLDGETANKDGFIVVTQVGRQQFGLLVDGVFHTEEIVVKPLAKKLRYLTVFSGNTILGDGAVVLIVDPGGIARKIGSIDTDPAALIDYNPDLKAEEVVESVALLVFRTGGEGFKAVPLSLVTRLEEVDGEKIEWVAGNPLLQYRGRLMPLIHASDAAINTRKTQPVVVFSDEERMMGLVVDEIVDIVDEPFEVQLVANRPDLIGSAIVRGRATEIINIAHYLPIAHQDWLQRSRSPTDARTRTVLLVDDSAFFRDMLAPVLKAAGYRVNVVETANEALVRLSGPRTIDVVVTDIEMPEKNGFDLAESIRSDMHLSTIPIIALSSYANPDMLEQARRLGINDFIAKFDRTGLLNALNETLRPREDAA